jgi:CBS domain-containing protein
MLRWAKVHRPTATVAEVRALFTDDHVHCALLAEAGRLIAVVDRDDLGSCAGGAPAARYGTLDGRIVHPDADLEATRRSMLCRGRRRLAVIDDDGTLLGLLCLKRSSLGFCTDSDVQARAMDRGDRLGPPYRLA